MHKGRRKNIEEEKDREKEIEKREKKKSEGKESEKQCVSEIRNELWLLLGHF